MRHRQRGRHLGRDSAHRRAMFRNLVTDLLRYERITTTEAKAKEIRPLTEKMVTLGRRGDLHSRRQALKYVIDGRVVDHLFENIGPRMADRPGGYLRITRLEPRKGDNAKMAAIEFVDYWEDTSVDADAPAEAEEETMTEEEAAPEAVAEDEALAESEPTAEDTVEESDGDESEAEAEEESSDDAELDADEQKDASEES